MIRRTTFLFLIAIALSKFLLAQTDSELTLRVEEYIEYNRKLKFDKVIDYTYPKIFEQSSKKQVSQMLKVLFESNELFDVTIDSLRTKGISEIINFEKGKYAKVGYSFVLRMKFKKMEITEELKSQLSEKLDVLYGSDNIRFEDENKQVVILINNELIAAKDEISPKWTFANFKKGDLSMLKIFKSSLLEKIGDLEY